MQQQVGQVAFRVDQDRRHTLQGGFLQQGDAQPCLPGPGHAGHHRVRRQVRRIVLQRLVAQFCLGGVVKTSKIEFIAHGRASGVCRLLYSNIQKMAIVFLRHYPMPGQRTGGQGFAWS